MIHIIEIFPGLAGKDDWEAAQLDAIADCQKDFWSEILEWYLKRAYNMGNGDLVTSILSLKWSINFFKGYQRSQVG